MVVGFRAIMWPKTSSVACVVVAVAPLESEVETTVEEAVLSSDALVAMPEYSAAMPFILELPNVDETVIIRFAPPTTFSAKKTF